MPASPQLINRNLVSTTFFHIPVKSKLKSSLLLLSFVALVGWEIWSPVFPAFVPIDFLSPASPAFSFAFHSRWDCRWLSTFLLLHESLMTVTYCEVGAEGKWKLNYSERTTGGREDKFSIDFVCVRQSKGDDKFCSFSFACCGRSGDCKIDLNSHCESTIPLGSQFHTKKPPQLGKLFSGNSRTVNFPRLGTHSGVPQMGFLYPPSALNGNQIKLNFTFSSYDSDIYKMRSECFPILPPSKHISSCPKGILNFLCARQLCTKVLLWARFPFVNKFLIIIVAPFECWSFFHADTFPSFDLLFMNDEAKCSFLFFQFYFAIHWKSAIHA